MKLERGESLSVVSFLFIVVSGASLAGCAAPRAETTAPPTSTATPPPAAVSTSSAGARAVHLVELAPELNPASAALVLDNAPSSTLTDVELAELGLVLASTGFDALDRATLRELKDLFGEAYASLGPNGERRVGDYIRRVRDASLSPAESREGREMLTRGVRGLAPARRARLQVLWEQAVRAGIDGRRASEQRGREFQAAFREQQARERELAEASKAEFAKGVRVVRSQDSTPWAAKPSGPVTAGGVGSGGDRGESYWRSRVQSARDAVTRAEARVLQADTAASRATYDPTSETCVPSQRIKGTRDVQFEECARGRQNVGLMGQSRRASAAAEVARAQAELTRARAALDAVEEEARRGNALPGWVR